MMFEQVWKKYSRHFMEDNCEYGCMKIRDGMESEVKRKYCKERELKFEIEKLIGIKYGYLKIAHKTALSAMDIIVNIYGKWTERDGSLQMLQMYSIDV